MNIYDAMYDAYLQQPRELRQRTRAKYEQALQRGLQAGRRDLITIATKAIKQFDRADRARKRRTT